MDEPIWIDCPIAEALHTYHVGLHGGLRGLRDKGLLESALARPQQRWSYELEADLFDLAAAYAFGLAKNHPFLDGNKRVAFVTAGVFLGLNGWRLVAPEAEAVLNVLALAAGELDEQATALWFRTRSIPAGDTPPAPAR